MLAGFWGSVGASLSDRWVAVGGPALVFWVGVALSWVLSAGGLASFTDAAVWLDGQSVPVQVAVLGGLLLVVVASGVLVSRLTTPTLRLLEGYWPGWAGGLSERRLARVREKQDKDVKEWHDLPVVREGVRALTPEEARTRARLESGLRFLPVDPERLMPTRTGNILRYAETRPNSKYGLDSVVVWPRLWLVLPEHARRDVATARAALDGAVSAVVWGFVFAAVAVVVLVASGVVQEWSPRGVGVAVLAFLVGVGVAVSAVRWWVPDRAMTYGALVEACYDIYRDGVYEAMRWPLPTGPSQEKDAGRALCMFLERGLSKPGQELTRPS